MISTAISTTSTNFLCNHGILKCLSFIAKVSMVTLGFTPERLTVVVSKDADFFSSLQNKDGDWSSTASLELRFGDIVWTATIVGDLATFSESEEAVNALIESRARVAKLFYLDSSDDTDLCWAQGKVEING